MRFTLPALLVCMLARAPLAAQAPAPDAPLPQHVAHLVTLASGGFAEVRGEGTTGAATSFNAAMLASSYAMRFRGVDAQSGVTINFRWNVMHETRLPVLDGADVKALWAAAFDGISRALPAGWQAHRFDAPPGPAASIAWWAECANGGRSLSLRTNAPYEAPALYLIVYRYDAPCSS